MYDLSLPTSERLWKATAPPFVHIEYQDGWLVTTTDGRSAHFHILSRAVMLTPYAYNQRLERWTSTA